MIMIGRFFSRLLMLFEVFQRNGYRSCVGEREKRVFIYKQDSPYVTG